MREDSDRRQIPVSRLANSLNERVCDVCVLSSRSSEPEKQEFAQRFPYWKRGLSTLLEKAGGDPVGFISFGSVIEQNEPVAAGKDNAVGKWIVANAYDEWSESLSTFEQNQSCPVEWMAPDWPEEFSSNVENEGFLLFIGDWATDYSLLADFILEAVEAHRGLPARSLDVSRCESPAEAMELVSKASACISLLGDRQMEHWLYLKALQSGCECWVAVGDDPLDARYLGDANRNRIHMESQRFAKLRPLFQTVGQLKWTGRLEHGAYGASRQYGRAFRDWLIERSKLAPELVNGLLPRDQDSGVELEGVTPDRGLFGILETLEGNAKPAVVGPLLNLGSDSRRSFFESLVSRRYSSKWAEVFLYRDSRDQEFLSTSLEAAKSGAGFGGRKNYRALVKIGRALLEEVRLSVFGYNEERLKLATTLLREGFDDSIESCGDLLGGLGLACSLTEDEDRLDEFASEYLSRFPGAGDFYVPIADHWLRLESCEKALPYVERELVANGVSDVALMLQIDACCQLKNVDRALEAAQQLSDNNLGLARIATAPLRLGWIWNSKEALISEDELRTYWDVGNQIDASDFMVNRAMGLYSTRLGLWDVAEAAFSRVLDAAPIKEAAIGQLQMNLALLGVDPKRFSNSEIGKEDNRWVRSVDDVLVLAITASQERSDASDVVLRALLEDDNELARLEGVGSLTEASAVRSHALMLMKLTGSHSEDEREALARRLLPKFGRSTDRLPEPFTLDREQSLNRDATDMKALLCRANEELEFWFLDV